MSPVVGGARIQVAAIRSVPREIAADRRPRLDLAIVCEKSDRLTGQPPLFVTTSPAAPHALKSLKRCP
jgi:hypothetical protein